MEVPEKLYVSVGDAILDIYSKKESNEEIEYTRTDAFIEKVYNWLKNYAFVDDDGCTYWPTLLHDFLKDSRNF